jgi:hypothetical protein
MAALLRLGKEEIEMKTAKIKFRMVGSCPNCGKRYRRKPPIDAVACMCTNPKPTLVPLFPTLIVPTLTYKKLSTIASLTNVSTEKLVNELLTESVKQWMERQGAMPEIVVVARGNRE